MCLTKKDNAPFHLPTPFVLISLPSSSSDDAVGGSSILSWTLGSVRILPVSSTSLVLWKESWVEVWLSHSECIHTSRRESSSHTTHWHPIHGHTCHRHSHTHAAIHTTTATSHVWSTTHVHAVHATTEPTLVEASTAHVSLETAHLALRLESAIHATREARSAEATTHTTSKSASSTETTVVIASVLLEAAAAASHIAVGFDRHILRKCLERIDVWVAVGDRVTLDVLLAFAEGVDFLFRSCGGLLGCEFYVCLSGFMLAADLGVDVEGGRDLTPSICR